MAFWWSYQPDWCVTHPFLTLLGNPSLWIEKHNGRPLIFLCIYHGLSDHVSNYLTGALWAHLVPTVIVLAAYFCLADVILIIQCLYYSKFKNSTTEHTTRGRSSTPSSGLSEHSPLLPSSPSHSQTRHDARSASGTKRTASKASSGLPGSLRRLSSVSQPPHPGTLTKDWEAATEDENSWSRNILSILAVIAVGVAGWAFAWKSGAWRPVEEPENVVDGQKVALGAEILGYISAVAYLMFVSLLYLYFPQLIWI